MHGADILSDIGTAIVAATVAALLARAARQPLILGYLVAGVLVGPEMGFALVHARESVHVISELGLILLLFIIGLEMDPRKLLSAGRPLVVTGLVQFPVCTGLGLVVALALGFPQGGGRFDALYVGLALGLSSTMIAVKLLYDKHELMTLPGRITLGVLVFQDVWAIAVLAVQPTLHDPSAAALGAALVKGVLLVGVSLGASRYVMPRVMASSAKVPELMLVTALAWCFTVAGVASALGLSREMGALIAGLSLSTFPYNVDVIAKVTSIRDFFVTLFFVALGMQVPVPTPSVIGMAAALSGALVVTRFLTVSPVLHALRSSLRSALLPALNLSQMSEFSLVIAALGLSLGHVDARTAAVLTFAFAITSVASTYVINWNHELGVFLARVLARVGVRERGADAPDHAANDVPDLVFLGFYRDASSILHEFEAESGADERSLLHELLVVDFNPQVLDELRRRGVAAVYGDVASPDTLHHAAIHDARVIFCTLTDSILKGTTNARLLRQLRREAPDALIVVTADTIAVARELYEEGADYVFLPRLHSAHHMADVLRTALEDGLQVLRAEESASLQRRDEVLA